MKISKNMLDHIEKAAGELFFITLDDIKEPLDGDETEQLARLYERELDFLNGNMNNEEAEEWHNTKEEIRRQSEV